MKNKSNNYYFDDFTESNYSKLILMAKRNYDFVSYNNYKSKQKNVLWRHDVDFSPQRALKIATIESKKNLSSTFFIQFNSIFYNLLEEEIILLLRRIIDLGHEIGLHFDPSYYFNLFGNTVELSNYIKLEKNFLEKVLGTNLVAISLHNPDSFSVEFQKEKILKMVNVNSDYIKNKYSYCSDSNGYWRYRRLENVLIEAKDTYLQVLTHPEWWVPSPMSPRERINRCIEGRAKKQNIYYDELLKSLGRENIR